LLEILAKVFRPVRVLGQQILSARGVTVLHDLKILGEDLIQPSPP
jgi:hypothetical protein